MIDNPKLQNTHIGQGTGLFSAFLERQRIKRAIALLEDGDAVLDIGCGRGALLESLIQLDRKVRYTGIDSLESVVANNSQKYPGFRFFCASAEDLQILPLQEKFSKIIMLAIFEHLHNPAAVLQKVSQTLKEEGRIILTAPSQGFEKIYALGARIGFFSKEAEEEHEDTFPNFEMFEKTATAAGLKITSYKRFLLGANQILELQRIK